MAKKPPKQRSGNSAARAVPRVQVVTAGAVTAGAVTAGAVSPVEADKPPELGLQATIDSLTARLAETISEVARIERAAVEMKAALAARDQRVVVLEGVIGERDARVATLEAEVAGATQRATDLELSLTQVTDLQRLLEATVGELRECVAAAGAESARLSRVLGDRDQEIALLVHQRDQDAARVASVEEDIARLQGQALDHQRVLEAELIEAQQGLERTAAALEAASLRGAALAVSIGACEQRIEALEGENARANGRAGALEVSLERTTELQRSLESEFDHLRRQLDLATAALSAARTEVAEQRGQLSVRDGDIEALRAEVARRGPLGTPVAVGRALADLFRVAHERRLDRLATTEPWRLPPNYRR